MFISVLVLIGNWGYPGKSVAQIKTYPGVKNPGYATWGILIGI